MTGVQEGKYKKARKIPEVKVVYVYVNLSGK